MWLGFVRRMEGGSLSRLTCSGTVHFLPYLPERLKQRDFYLFLTVFVDKCLKLPGARSSRSVRGLAFRVWI